MEYLITVIPILVSLAAKILNVATIEYISLIFLNLCNLKTETVHSEWNQKKLHVLNDGIFNLPTCLMTSIFMCIHDEVNNLFSNIVHNKILIPIT